jgi:membrane-associated phospholipid phosphatase
MDLGLNLPSTRLALGVLAAMLLGDIAGLWLTGIRIDGASATLWIKAAIAVAGIIALCGGARWYLRGDEARGARLVRGLADRAALFSAAGLLIGAITTVGAVFSYVMASAALPFQDSSLVAIDRALGFDWLGIARFVCSAPPLESLLAFAYRSSMAQVGLLLPVLALTGHRRRLSEFMALFALTGFVICILSALVPAQAAFFHFAPSVICPHAALDGTLAYHGDLLALRDGTFGTIIFAKMTGIVTFPSFHTALAIVVIYAASALRLASLPIILLNILVIASTMPLGGHYLTDVLTGAAIATLSILAVRALNRQGGADIAPVGAISMPERLFGVRIGA